MHGRIERLQPTGCYSPTERLCVVLCVVIYTCDVTSGSLLECPVIMPYQPQTWSSDRVVIFIIRQNDGDEQKLLVQKCESFCHIIDTIGCEKTSPLAVPKRQVASLDPFYLEQLSTS